MTHNQKGTEITVSTKIRTAAAASLAVLRGAGPAAAHDYTHASSSSQSAEAAYELRVAKRATAKFRDVRVVQQAGYVLASPCVAEPGQGPMEGHVPGQPIHYDLHVWLFKRNPAGLFSPFNPRVSC